MLSDYPEMKKIIWSLLVISLSMGAMAQTVPANYIAAVSKFTTLYNDNQPDSIYKMFGPEMVAALPQEKFKATMTQLKEQLGNLMQSTLLSYNDPVAVYKATFQTASLSMSISLNSGNQIIGLLFQQLKTPAQGASNAPAAAATKSAPSTAPVIDPSVVESPMTHKTLSATLHGTYTMPKNASGKIPVVLIIAGSGPTDRDGNSPKMDLATNAYKYLAWGLAKEGIASLRYDKRMIGESVTGNKEADLRFDDYVDDAVELVQMLNADDRFSKVIVLGHSEGSLVGMLASRGQDVKGCISIAGAGQPADKILTEQLKSKPDYQQEEFKTLLDSMKRGKTIDNIDPRLYYLARPSIQRYLMSWFRYDPARIIKLMKMPVLIIQGNTDLQVGTADADKLKKAKSDAVEIIIPNMNHVLKDAPADRDQNLATYNKPDLPLKAELLADVVKFVQGLN